MASMLCYSCALPSRQGGLAGWSPRTCRVSPVSPLAPYVGGKVLSLAAKLSGGLLGHNHYTATLVIQCYRTIRFCFIKLFYLCFATWLCLCYIMLGSALASSQDNSVALSYVVFPLLRHMAMLLLEQMALLLLCHMAVLLLQMFLLFLHRIAAVWLYHMAVPLLFRSWLCFCFITWLSCGFIKWLCVAFSFMFFNTCLCLLLYHMAVLLLYYVPVLWEARQTKLTTVTQQHIDAHSTCFDWKIWKRCRPTSQP